MAAEAAWLHSLLHNLLLDEGRHDLGAQQGLTVLRHEVRLLRGQLHVVGQRLVDVLVEVVIGRTPLVLTLLVLVIVVHGHISLLSN